MQTEATGLLPKMWKAISAKRTMWGWVLALVSALFYFSNGWDSLQSLYEKLKKLGPFFKFIAEVAESPLCPLIILVAGIIWVGLAAWFSASALPVAVVDKKNGPITSTSKPNRQDNVPKKLQIACNLHEGGCHDLNQWEAGPVYFLRISVKTDSL